MSNITVYYDEQDPHNNGWAFRVSGGTSGPIDGAAAAALNAIDDGIDEDGAAAIIDSIDAHPGDRVWFADGRSVLDLTPTLFGRQS